MEIVIITGVVALVGVVLLTLRMRATRSRGTVQRSRSARQWSGSAGSARRAGRAQPAAAAAGGAGGAVAFHPAGGGVAVQDPPRTGEADLDAWDDDLEWTDDLDAAPDEAAPTFVRPAAVEAPPAPEPEPAPELEPARRPEALEPEPRPAPHTLPAAPPAEEPAWDDDLSVAPLRPALPDGAGQPIPSARGAAAFGAAQAKPPAPAPKPPAQPVSILKPLVVLGDQNAATCTNGRCD